MNYISILIIVLELFNFVLFVRVLMSWLPMGKAEGMRGFLAEITDPLLTPIQKIIPPLAGIDFSPIILFFIISELTDYLTSFLH